MTNFLPGGLASAGRIVRCPLPSRHPLVELLCADGGDFVNVCDRIPYISIPESLLCERRHGVDRALFRKLNECVAELLGKLHVFWVFGSSVVYLPSYFALSRSQSFGLLCLLLAMLFCLLLALLFSVLFIISPLLDVERCSASASSLRCSSRCPRTCVAPLSSFHHKLVHCGSVSDSHHLLLGCGSICISLSPLPSWLWLSLILSRDTLW